MNFELDTLIALAFVVPVAFFAVLNLVTFRTGGYGQAVRPTGRQAVDVAPAMDASPAMDAQVVAANDGEVREAA